MPGGPCGPVDPVSPCGPGFTNSGATSAALATPASSPIIRGNTMIFHSCGCFDSIFHPVGSVVWGSWIKRIMNLCSVQTAWWCCIGILSTHPTSLISDP